MAKAEEPNENPYTTDRPELRGAVKWPLRQTTMDLDLFHFMSMF
jgi:hypothetical protein